MTTFAQTSTNDITTSSISSGGVTKSFLSYESDRNAYSLIVADVIRTLVGELQLDVEKGIPWMSTILSTTNKMAIWKHYVAARVQELEFVSQIVSFDASYNQATKTVRFTIVIRDKAGDTAILEDSYFSN